MYFIELFLLIITIIGKVLRIRNSSINGYKWVCKNIILTKLVTIIIFFLLFY